MNKKKHISILAIEIIFLTLFLTFGNNEIEFLPKLILFPFEQIANTLRILSLSSYIGNIFALIIYIIFCLIPCITTFKNKFYPEDLLRPLLSLTLFFVMYQMINTGDNPIFKAILCGSIYSIIISYFIFKLIRKMIKSNKIYSYATVLFIFLNMLFVVAIFQNISTQILLPINNFEISNSGNYDLFALNKIFVIFKFMINNLPNAFNITIIFIILDLIKYFKIEKYSDNCISVAKKLSKICIISLVTILSSITIFNLAQIMMFNKLFNIDISVNIPVFSIIFILACLIFTKLIEENKELTEDNNSII